MYVCNLCSLWKVLRREGQLLVRSKRLYMCQVTQGVSLRALDKGSRQSGCGRADGGRRDKHLHLTVVACSRMAESSDDDACDTAATEFDASVNDLEVEDDSPVLCGSNTDDDVHEEPQRTLLSASPC